MAAPRLTAVLRHLPRLAPPDDAGGATDAGLLERFAGRGDRDAFEALVRRHGPLVWRVCRRVLPREDCAEDAFQATFLLLAQRAGSIRKPAALACWLHGVAYRVASRARASGGGGRAGDPEEQPARGPDPGREAACREIGRLIEQEVHALPAKYRAPVLLCYWEGRTNEEAARRLGWPPGTVKTRLARARELLRGRLTARGVTLPAGAVGLLLAPPAGAGAAVPAALLRDAAGHAAVGAGGVPVRVARLAREALPAAGWGRLRLAVALVLALGAAALGAATVTQPRPPEQPAGEERAAEAGRPAADGEGQARADLHGDPSPPGRDGPGPRHAGAKVRLGAPGFHAPAFAAHALTPDGKTVVTAVPGHLLYTALDTGREVKRVPLAKVDRRAFDRIPRAITLLAGGRRVLVDYTDHGKGGVGVYDAATGEALFTFDSYLFAASGDGSRAVVPAGEAAGGKGAVRVVDAATGKALAEFESPDGDIRGGAMAADGARVALLRHATKDVQICDAATGKEFARLPAKSPVWRAAFSPDGKAVVTSGEEGAVQAWDAVTGKLLRTFMPWQADADKLVYAPDGSRVGAVFASSTEFRVWDAATGDLTARGGLDGVALDLVLPAGRPGVALGKHELNGDRPTRFVAAALPGGPLTPAGGHLRAVAAVHFTRDGRHVLTADVGGRVVRWDAATGKELGRPVGPAPNAGPVGWRNRDTTACWFRPDGGMAAFADGLGVSAFDLRSGAKAFSVGDRGAVRTGGWSADGSRLLVVDGGDVGTVLDTKTRKPVGAVRAGPEAEFALLPDGKTVVSAAPAGTPGSGRARFELAATDVATGKRLASLRGPHACRARLTPLADGRTVVVTLGDHAGLMWDSATGEELRRFGGAPAAASADGRLVVLGVNEPLLMPGDLRRAWEWLGEAIARGRGKACGHGFKRDYRTRLLVVDVASGEVRCEVPSWREGAPPMAFSPDGTTLAVVEPDDTTVVLWDLTRPAEMRRPAGKR